MGARPEEPEIVNFDILPESFTVILFIIFDFKHFLTQVQRHNPYIMQLIPLEFFVQIRQRRFDL